MRIKHMLISLVLGLGLTLTLLWMLCGSTPLTAAAPVDRPLFDATPIHHVATTGTDSGDCSTPGSACETVQYAVDQAGDGDLIKVAAGTYTGVEGRPAPHRYSGSSVVTQVVYISKTVTLQGGYTTGNDFADPPAPASNLTTLDAQDQGRVLLIAGDVNPTVAGLRITGGDATGLGGHLGNDAGGGVFVISATATIEDNRVFSNIATQIGGGIYLVYSDATLNGNTVNDNEAGCGGGLGLNSSAATIRENIITANTSTNGGGVCVIVGDDTLSRNIIATNTADDDGGGVFLANSHDAILNGNTIITNTAADQGGGLYLSSSNATLDNNLIASNAASPHGTAIAIWASSPLLRHNTLAGNGGSIGTGVYASGTGNSPSRPRFYNTILVGHYTGVYPYTNAQVWLEGTLWGSGAWANSTDWNDNVGHVFTNTVNIWDDPDFVNPAAFDYHINTGSGAVDAGVYPTIGGDVDDEPRPMGLAPDIGADEYSGPGLRLHKWAWQNLSNPGETITYTLVVTGVGTGAVNDVILTDNLPPEQRAVAGTASVGSCTLAPTPVWGGQVTCNLGSLNVGDNAYVTLTAEITTALPYGFPWQMRNNAWVTGTQAANLTYADSYLQDCHVRLNDAPYEWNNVQAAVEASTQSTDVVKVAGYCTVLDEYAGPPQMVHINKTITLRGGYAVDDWDTPDPDAHPTTLDMRDKGRVLYITDDAGPTVEGLRLIGGDATDLGGDLLTDRDAGSGVYVVSATATLSNCWVSGSNADYGGGMYVAGATVTLSDCRVFGSSAYDGGGMYVVSATATLSNCQVSGNHADSNGGGIYLYDSPATLSENTIGPNSAANDGGGVYIASAAVTLSNCQVSGNYADYNGGGIYLSDSPATLSGNTVGPNSAHDGGGLYLNHSPVTLTGNAIGLNGAENDGAGLYLYHSAATLVENAVFSNSAEYDGGGLFLSDSNAALNRNVVSGNSANYHGGGAYVQSGDAALDGNTILGNSAGQDGGGLYLSSNTTATLTNTIIADNQAGADGGGIRILDASPYWVHTTVAGNSDNNGRGVYISGASSAVTWINTILASQDMGVYLEPDNSAAVFDATLWNNTLTDFTNNITHTNDHYGDPAFVNSGAGDYHIGLTSAAIDQGVNAGVDDDIDGDPRPQNSGYDLGADETGMIVTKQADPDPVQAGAPLTYTIRITNTTHVSLTATITDLLPVHVTPSGVQTWTTMVTAHSGICLQTTPVTAAINYEGILTNVVQVTTNEGMAGTCTETSTVLSSTRSIYLPIVLRQ